jgi:hypothetical protein
MLKGKRQKCTKQNKHKPINQNKFSVSVKPKFAI